MQILSLGREGPLKKACNPLQCSCLENPMDRGAWQATVHGVSRVAPNLVTTPPPPRLVLKAEQGRPSRGSNLGKGMEV